MSSSPRRRRHRWSLQARLITAVVSFVSVILITVGLGTGTVLESVLRENLDAKVTRAQDSLVIDLNSRAEAILSRSRQERGTLLIVNNIAGPSAAYVDDEGDVRTLNIGRIASTPLDEAGWADANVEGLGDYRLHVQSAPYSSMTTGLPTSEVTSVSARIVTTVALLTTGGLLVLAAIIALLIRRALAPLRSVAATASRVAAMPLSEGTVRISERVPDEDTDTHTEVGQVGHALNTLLDHVETSLAARQRNEERMRAFVADASHELRTPLASIRGYSELSLRGIRQAESSGTAAPGIVAETTRESLERIQAQSLRMTALVEDLLLLARLDEGTELVYSAVDLTRLAVEAVSDARVAGTDHEWVLDVADEPVIVAGDTGRLHQVAANLLANARVHTPAGTRVTTTVETRDGEAVLRIHDDGPGIDPSIVDDLFERFSRADSSRARQTGGTGLGLSIARAIVTGHGGRIVVASEPGSTTFEVRLPARPDSPADSSAA
ncbi:cell wall metabolism sensor histidine kinase WalK [Microbacterium sp. 77mftsu3.1]|uniref:sensor histidine kinase n=1 Tax=Microbacterium sp. 77mftsu3.1 TaxID=1761802 RepID=UPI00035C7FD8|nr:HAMP domain-containing sensor histidine kinase [Microbacterium sp. 77mftsu3.1]SDG27657.1 two-component system, OmpR family, sensor kinase [Microbacterium sp. 77mftsu3.1]